MIDRRGLSRFCIPSLGGGSAFPAYVKVAEYLSAGVSAVVVIDPDVSTVTVHRPGGWPCISRRGEELDPSDVIRGFRCAVDDIFN